VLELVFFWNSIMLVGFQGLSVPGALSICLRDTTWMEGKHMRFDLRFAVGMCYRASCKSSSAQGQLGVQLLFEWSSDPSRDGENSPSIMQVGKAIGKNSPKLLGHHNDA